MINVITRKKLKGATPVRIIRSGPFNLIKKYEYNFTSTFLYKQAVKLNPDAGIAAAGGIIGGRG